MIQRHGFAACVMAVCMTPADAGNESRFEAFKLSADRFEIVADFTENAIYWCGASIYARDRLGAKATQKIYVIQGPAPSSARPDRVSVRFSLTPPPQTDSASTYSNSVGIVGNALSVAQASGGCTERSSSG